MATKNETAKKKPVTTFNKGYVGDRIAARQASLRLKLNGLETFFENDRVEQEEFERDYLERLRQAAVNLIADIDKSSGMEAGTPEWEIARIAIHDKHYKFFRDVTSRYTYASRNEAQTNRVLKQKMERELDQLDHAAAYFHESPVEEYSVTALRQLGLLSVVQFVTTN